MKFHITSTKLTGNPGDAGWAQIHEFKPEEEEKLKLRGHLFAVISTQEQKEGVEFAAVGREILARLHEEYFGEVSLTAFSALKKAVEKVIGEFEKEIGQIEIAAAAMVDKTVYSAAGGGAQVAVFRDGMLASILESEKGSTISASGHPKKGDLLLLGSTKFFNEVKKGVLKAALEGGDPHLAVETFAPMAHAKEGLGSLGLAVIKFEEKHPLSPLELGKKKKGKPKEEGVEEKRKIKFSKPGAGVFEKVKSFVKNNLPDKRIYIRRSEVDVEDLQKRKTTISIGIILLALLVISIFFGVRQVRTKARREKYEARLTEAKHNLEEARSLFTLNPDRARELFSQSAAIVKELEEEGVKDQELLTLKTKLEQERQSVLGEHSVVSDQFLNLSLIEGFSAHSASAGLDKMYVLDRQKERVAEIEVSNKKTKVIAGPSQIDNPQMTASYSDRVFVLEEDGIFEVGDNREKVVEDKWDGEVLIFSYAGNLYVLDKAASKIWRYPGIEGGFASSNDWLAPGIKPDLSKVVSWAIDGSVWILTSTGNVEKYTSGNPKTLGSMNVSPPIKNSTHIYTNKDLEFFYLLDPATKRVVVFDKEGNYKAQYKSEELKNAIGLFVSEKEGKIIFLTKDKLYSIKTEHSS